jgi:hypothetical protein
MYLHSSDMWRTTLMARFASLVVALATVMLGCARQSARTASPLPSPLAAMAERYATCSSYEDSGTLIDIRIDRDGSRHFARRLTFSTVFDRATGAFAFRYSIDERPRGALWRSSMGPAHLWAAYYPDKMEVDISRGIAALTGVSSGTSYEVSTRLLGLRNVMDKQHFHLEREEAIQGLLCVKLVTDDGNLALWIAKNERTLQRVFNRVRLDPRDLLADPRIASHLGSDERKRIEASLPFTSEKTIEYKPVLDHIIDASRFDFTPPVMSTTRSEAASVTPP